MGFFEFFAGALALLYAGVKSYGLAIILLTLVVRVVLLPLSIKQTRSMREMQRIQPEIKKLQQKYKGNKQKLNEEMMALYKEHGVNPFGGCLPLVMQFPVFIALYRVVREPLAYMGYHIVDGVAKANPGLSGVMETLHGSALAQQLLNHTQAVNSFLTMHLDCTPTEVFRETAGAPSYCASSSPISWIPYVILILLMGATTYWQQKQLQGSRAPGTSMTPQQQQMQAFTKVMPAVLMFFSVTFPTGLTLYWLTSNVWTVFQQRMVLGPIIAAEDEKKPSGKSPAPKPAGGKAAARGGKTAAKSTKNPSKAGGDASGKRTKAKQPSGSSKKKRK